MKAIWFLEEVLYLTNAIFLKATSRKQESRREQGEESPFKLPAHTDKPTCKSSPWLLYPEAILKWLNADALIGQTSFDS